MTAGHWLPRLLTALAPLAGTFLFAFLTMEGHLNFGSGEKDLFLAVPLLVFSVFFLAGCLIAWWRGLPAGRSVYVSALASLGLLAFLWMTVLAVVVLQ